MIQFKLIKNQWALSIASSIRDKCNLLILPAYIFIISCQQANFSNASPKQKENDVIAEKENLSSEQNANSGDIKSINTLSFSCDDLSTGTATIEKDKLLNKVRIGGELCLAPKKDNEDSNVNILFVIDLSGSMKVNDQFKNDTCGRYNAVNAILDQIVSLNTAMFGIIGFSNQATTISPINKVSSDINIDPQQLCGSEGATSYGNALNRAYELLKDKSGKKVVYLISDGLPDSGLGNIQINTSNTTNVVINGNKLDSKELDAKKFGLDAANELRELENLSLYAIYLDGEGSEGRKDRMDYLSEITGSSNNIKIVSQAGELVEGILIFKDAVSNYANLSKAYLQFLLQNDKEKIIDMTTFERSSEGNFSRWKFESAVFSVDSQDAIMDNEIRVVAESDDGNLSESIIFIEEPPL